MRKTFLAGTVWLKRGEPTLLLLHNCECLYSDKTYINIEAYKLLNYVRGNLFFNIVLYLLIFLPNKQLLRYLAENNMIWFCYDICF